MVKVKTGFGYFKDENGNIIAKAELPIGEHPLKEGYTYHEVKSKAELDAIEVYTPPIVETEEQERERLIQAKIRELAVKELKKEGKL